MPIKGEEFEGNSIALEVVFNMSPQHDPHFKVFLMRWNSEEDLWVIIHTVVVIVHLGCVIRLEVEFTMDALRIRINLGIPTEGDRVEVVTDLFCPNHIEDSCF